MSCGDGGAGGGLGAPPGPADVLVDLVELGVSLSLPPLRDGGLAGLCGRLGDLGVSAVAGSAVLPARVEIGSGAGGPAGMDVSGSLRLSESGGGIAVGPSSSLRFNCLRALRGLVEPVCGPGLDGGRNLVAEYADDYGDLLGLQLDLAGRAVGGLLAAVSEAAGGGPRPEGRIRLRRFEACRDHGVPDAPSVASALRLAPPPPRFGEWGAVVRRGGLVTIHWDDGGGRGRIRVKLYPKLEDMLRVEVVLSDSEAAARLLGGGRGVADVAADGPALAGLLGRAAAASAPLLDEAWAWASGVDLTRRVDVPEFLARLAPLLDVIAPPLSSGGGRPTGERTVALAYEALGKLVEFGRFSAAGVRADSPVRRALEEMSAAPGAEGLALAKGGPRGTDFSVLPELDGARAVLAGAFLPSAERAPGQVRE